MPGRFPLSWRNASDRRLVVDAGLGLLVGVGVLILRPPLWSSMAGLAGALSAFGFWGILDREVRDSADPTQARRWLRAARGAVAALGAISGLAGALTLFTALRGSWVS
jgi:hypothetical protein